MGMKRIALDWGDRVRRSAWRLIALPGPFRWLGRHLEPVLRTFDERYWERQWVVERSRDPGVLADAAGAAAAGASSSSSTIAAARARAECP